MNIRLHNICKSYRSSIGGVERSVLIGLDLEIAQGETIAIMGPSGSGKTTLLNLLGTLDRPDSGSLQLDGRSVSDFSESDIRTYRNRTAGLVFQSHQLLPQCTLLENILLPTLAYRGDAEALRLRAEQLASELGIWEQRDNKPGELSGGECQRAALARALINGPTLLLADEPTGSLDGRNAEQLIELLLDINRRRNVTLVVATHSTSVASRMNRTYILEDGKLRPWQEA
jgi:ABC-type lipoprotein export system ATPase subunit